MHFYLTFAVGALEPGVLSVQAQHTHCGALPGVDAGPHLTQVQLSSSGAGLGIRALRSPSLCAPPFTPALHLLGLVLPPKPWAAFPEVHFCSKRSLRGANQGEMRPCSCLAPCRNSSSLGRHCPQCTPPWLLESGPTDALFTEKLCCPKNKALRARCTGLTCSWPPALHLGQHVGHQQMHHRHPNALLPGPSPPHRPLHRVRCSGPHFPGVCVSALDEAAGALHNCKYEIKSFLLSFCAVLPPLPPAAARKAIH